MNVLETYRHNKKMTYEALAKVVGLSSVAVYRHCKKQRPISGESALLYHIKLGIPLKELRPDLYEQTKNKAA
ncbi:helix-turn-helix domain-containing protein [Maridesulfovibrio bastinii]|uniref:helix-turn-helix domain-containing protein n=1 Tax=Maridesulfovibrio bastinii TaxID=47157 RepID=UPI00040B8F3A|nr:helix-turn-helix transcriptional regulator [Maridesulfovibrio bastinii]